MSPVRSGWRWLIKSTHTKLPCSHYYVVCNVESGRSGDTRGCCFLEIERVSDNRSEGFPCCFAGRMQICGGHQIQLLLFTARLFHHDKHSHMHTYTHPVFASFIHVALYLNPDRSCQRPLFIRGATRLTNAVKRRHMCTGCKPPHPPVLFNGHTPAFLHMLRLTGRLFSGLCAKLAFSPGGEGTSCLEIEHVAVPRYAAGMSFMCWFSFRDSSRGGAFCLVGHRRVTLTICPPARRADRLIKCRVGLSRGSQECRGIWSLELISVWWQKGQRSVIFSEITGSVNSNTHDCMFFFYEN